MKLTLGSSGGHLKALKYGSTPQPGRDWLVLLAAWAILFLISVGYHLWLFSRVTIGESLDDTQAVVEPKVVDTSAATDVFERRAGERERYLGSYRFVDPS
jgi:hypothetical protein